MYDISPSVTIDASPEDVCALLVDVEEWWVASNTEHESLEIVSDDEVLGAETRLRVEERIAGIPGIAEDELTSFVPGKQVTWEAPLARYRYFGLPLTVAEGVTWELTPAGERTELTAHVWASFPDTLLDRLVEWSFVYLLDGVDRDYDHAMRELEYLKRTLEAQ